MTYRFVGTSLQIGDVLLERVGQVYESEETPDPRWPLVTNAHFEAAGFDAEHLQKFAHHRARALAPQEFIAKLQGLWKLVGVADAPKQKGSK